jgi:drug/metabolite transporter (DMT)-like permease
VSPARTALEYPTEAAHGAAVGTFNRSFIDAVRANWLAAVGSTLGIPTRPLLSSFLRNSCDLALRSPIRARDPGGRVTTTVHSLAMRAEAKGALAILGSSLGYATLPVLAKMALDAGVEVLPLLAWRFLIGAALVWLVFAATRRETPARAILLPLLGLGTLYATNSFAFMAGLVWIPASLASLVFFTYPAVVVLLARVFVGEPLTTRRLTALVLALIGCALTAGFGLSGGDPRGVFLVLVSVALIAVFIVASHPVLEASPELAGSAVILTGTALVTVAVTAAVGDFALPGGPRVVLIVVLLGALSTALPVTLFLVGIKWIGPARAAVFSTLEPAFTVLLAALVLRERLTGLQLAGGALILIAVVWLRLERPLADEPKALDAP